MCVQHALQATRLMAAREGCCRAEPGPGKQCENGCLIEAFRSSGGVATGSELAAILSPLVDQSISRVARWIVSRQVVTFAWRATILIPLFQFDLDRMCFRAGMHSVCSEFSGAMDSAEIVLWFALPNAWLDGATPAKTMAIDVGAVLDAARADRFIAQG
jgi:hypothetical protein